MTLRIAILTISDRSARGERPDLSGPALREAVERQGWLAVHTAVLPDELDQITAALTQICDQDQADIILTTGGTGFAPRDITPEATRAVIQKDAPGLSEVMRQASLRATPHAMLSRAVAGIRGRTLIVNFPGSPKAALENFMVIAGVLPHAVELLREDPDSELHH